MNVPRSALIQEPDAGVAAPPDARTDLPATRATRLLFQSTFVFWGHFVDRAAELGLTPAQAHALTVLEPQHPLTMRELADALDCDPSTVTGLADRLETHGLVERGALAGDRRVTVVGMTGEGARRRSQLLERLGQAPESVLALDRQSLERLADGLESILTGETGGAQKRARHSE
jgi:DNA-binding MarR family transcriptional regulator